MDRKIPDCSLARSARKNTKEKAVSIKHVYPQFTDEAKQLQRKEEIAEALWNLLYKKGNLME